MSPFASKDKARAYQRKYQRDRRSEAKAAGVVNHLDFRLTSIEDLRWVFEQIISEVLPAEMDLGIKGRVVAQLINAGCKLLEQSELEARMCAVEERLGITASQWR
jgi:hypothetical protein